MENDRTELESLLLEHCYEMNILKKNALNKKKEAILDSLIISIVRTGLKIEEVKECIKDVKEDKVIDLNFFKKRRKFI